MHLNPSKHKNPQSKLPLHSKEYHDETQIYQPRHTDSPELRQLKQKMKILVNKLTNNKKERDQLQQNNQMLEKQVQKMQQDMRHMVGGFSNTSTAFPLPQELVAKITQFYKCHCLDIYFDLLAPEELTLKGLIYFYMQLFATVNLLTDQHFAPALTAVQTVGCLDSLQGPVMNVLRKAFQTKHQNILQTLNKNPKITLQAQKMIDELGLGSSDRGEALQMVQTFLKKWLQIVVQCRISDPPLELQVQRMGRRVQFSGLSHDPFDGFVRGGEECFVILPQVRKGGQLVVKGLVLSKDYDPCG